MDTTRSKKMAQEFLAKEQPFKRKVQVYKKQFSAAPEIVFPQFCPTRAVGYIIQVLRFQRATQLKVVRHTRHRQ